MKKPFLLVLVTVSLLVSCKKNKATLIEEDRLIIPNFTWTGQQIAPAVLNFNNTTTSNAKTYAWNFNNGNVSALQHPQGIQFTQAGAYTVTLNASDGLNKVFTSKVILISENANPVASFSYSFKNQQSFAPAIVQFTNESVNADSYEWNINGQIDQFRTPLDHTFTQAGDYSVKLIAKKGNVSSTVFEQIITVAANTNPVASFQVGLNPGGYFVGQDINFVNRSTNSDQYVWNFGANGIADSGEQHPSVRYQTPGDYTITLTAKRGALTATRTTTIRVKPF